MSIILALLIFGLLVFFHELGHFLLAKKNGITVIEFSIGMGPRLFSFTLPQKKMNSDSVQEEQASDENRVPKDGTKGTLYSFRLLPIGGSCQMAGEDEATEDENGFNSKSVWARISVVAAGPVFNFILAFLMAVIVMSVAGVDRPQIGSLMEGYPAQEAGLMQGDVIQRVNGKRIHLFREMSLYVATHPGEPLSLTVSRSGEEREVTVTPEMDEKGYYYIGILSIGRVKENALHTLSSSFFEVKYQISYVVEALKMLVKGKVSVNDLSGPVGIVSMVSDVVDESTAEGATAAQNMLNVLINLLQFSIMISANLGVMNLLPIPGLDGGRLLFLVIEAVRRKPLDREKEGMVHFVGLMLLMALMAFVMFNDIRRLF